YLFSHEKSLSCKYDWKDNSLFLHSLKSVFSDNWVRCKPVGPRRGEGADGSRSLFTSSIGTQNPELGPIRETIVRQLKGQSEPALLHFEIGLDLRWGQGLPLAFVRMAKALADFLAE